MRKARLGKSERPSNVRACLSQPIPERTGAMHGKRITADMACSARFTAIGACARERGRAVRALPALYHVPNLARAISWTSSLRDIVGRETATARWIVERLLCVLERDWLVLLAISEPMSECASANQK